MNPPPSEQPQVFAIAERQPVFPCWLKFKATGWNYFYGIDANTTKCATEDSTHWSDSPPDKQPSAPTVRPDEPTGCFDDKGNVVGKEKGIVSDTLAAPHPHSPASKGGTVPVLAERGIPQWAKEAAKECSKYHHLWETNLGTPTLSQLHAGLALIIAKHAPHPRKTEGKGAEPFLREFTIGWSHPSDHGELTVKARGAHEAALLAEVDGVCPENIDVIQVVIPTLPSSASLPESAVDECVRQIMHQYSEQLAGCLNPHECIADDLRAQLALLKSSPTNRERALQEALEIAISTVECDSLDNDGNQLPWYRAAKKAIALPSAVPTGQERESDLTKPKHSS